MDLEKNVDCFEDSREEVGQKSLPQSALVSNIYLCTQCDKRWLMKDVSVDDINVAQHIFNSNSNPFSPEDDDNNNNNNTYDNTALPEKDPIVKESVCPTCTKSNVNKKYYMSTKNPYKYLHKTGKMSRSVECNLHSRTQDLHAQLKCITFERHWLSDYCIAPNCLHKATTYGYCKGCYTRYKKLAISSPSLRSSGKRRKSRKRRKASSPTQEM